MTNRESLASTAANTALAAVLLAAGGCGSLEFAPTDSSWTRREDWPSHAWRHGHIVITCGGRHSIAGGDLPLAGTIHDELGEGATATIRRVGAAPSASEPPVVLGTTGLDGDRQVLESVAFGVVGSTLFLLRIDRDVTPDDPVRLGDEASYVLEIRSSQGDAVCPLRMKVVRGKSDLEWWEPVVILPLSPFLLCYVFGAKLYTYIVYGHAH